MIAVFGIASAAEWRLVGAYDAAALATKGGLQTGYVWGTGAPGMNTSCGRPKGPDGLGIFEAEAVASHLTPALVLLVQRTRGEGGLSTEDVRLAVTDGDRRVLLQPMVLPRHLRITLDVPDELARFGQLVRTQLEVETCLEHKTGRGWTGHGEERVRQAFLLEEAIGGERSRKFFGGQLDPVAALLGPPDACVVGPAPDHPARPADSSLWLVPTDVWGAGLRSCESTLPPPVPIVPLRLPGTGDLPVSMPWTEVSVRLALAEGEGPEEERIRFTVASGERVLAQDEALYVRKGSTLGQQDLLALLSHEYPLVAGDRVPLVVPEWQVVEALRRLGGDGPPDGAMPTAPQGVADAVGSVLAHPELLSLQVRPASGEDWPNLAGVLEGGVLSEPFGFTTGYLASREPLVMIGGTPGPDENARGQRSTETSALLAGLVACGVGLLAGARRLRDLWARVPYERAHYWPGLEKPLLDSKDTVDVPAEGT